MSAKKLNAVAHNIAHHAQSSLSYLHPYLSEGCREGGIHSVQLDLFDGTYSCGFSVSRPLALSTAAIREKFCEMVAASGSLVEEIESAALVFQFIPGRRDDYYCAVRSTIRLRHGRELQHVVQ